MSAEVSHRWLSSLCRVLRPHDLLYNWTLSLLILSTFITHPLPLLASPQKSEKTACLPSSVWLISLLTHPVCPSALLQIGSFHSSLRPSKVHRWYSTETDIFSTGSSVDGRSGCYWKQCCEEHLSVDTSQNQSFHFLSWKHPPVEFRALFSFWGPPTVAHGDGTVYLHTGHGGFLFSVSNRERLTNPPLLTCTPLFLTILCLQLQFSLICMQFHSVRLLQG